MGSSTTRTPGPDHPITIVPHRDRIVVRAAGRVIADSTRALVLREASYRPVHYLPRTDVDMSLLERSDHRTHCPYKGDAAYFHLPLLGPEAANAAWSYEEPYASVAAIAGHLAFYPDRVEITEGEG